MLIINSLNIFHDITLTLHHYILNVLSLQYPIFHLRELHLILII